MDKKNPDQFPPEETKQTPEPELSDEQLNISGGNTYECAKCGVKPCMCGSVNP